MIWTLERTAELAKLWQEGLTVREIKERLGLNSRGAIAGKLNRMGLMGKPPVSGDRTRADRRKYTTRDCGSWDAKTFEPYAIRKIRLEAERGMQ